MTHEAQRIAIAKACGWRKDKRGLGWLSPSGEYSNLPDYLNDLNAMREAEKVLTQGTAEKIIHATNAYTSNLARILQCFDTALFQFAHAKAAQRAEAFLRTLNLWTDEQ